MSLFMRNISWLVYILLLASVLPGCSIDQVHSTADHTDFSLDKNDLETYGLAFITPSTVTGQEEDKQTLAFAFANAMQENRPDIRLVTLPETISAINIADLTEDYKRMYVDYRDTGVFKRELLKKVGETTGTRYLAQLKLSDFSQNSKSRFNLFGLRLLQTKEANIRIFFQIWDSRDGTIAWEGTEEMSYSWDTGSEKPVTFRKIVEKTAQNLISLLP
ncbi:MAG: hypothetical protein WBN81_15200 [Gammaproteobacteria bacterium]